MTYFSDREKTTAIEQLTECITIDIWNGIAIIINSLIANNNLAKDYPLQCPDGSNICGVDEHSFYIAAKSIIPTIDFLPEYGKIEPLPFNFLSPEVNPFEYRIDDKIDVKVEQFKYNVLDFIEFVFKHICDVENGHYHEFFRHYELRFPKTTTIRDKFVRDVNEIFERNHIAFKLTPDGEIQRIIDKELDILIASQKEPTEVTLQNLLQEATIKIKSHKIGEREIALEKLWDAFERIKTIVIPGDKHDSANKLLSSVSNFNNKIKDELDKECRTLTNIGNSFQIRHFETNKTPITDSEHIDYLFFRMYALIQLLLTKI